MYLDMFLHWVRQSSTIFGLSVAVGTTVGLATKQMTLGAAEAFYGTAFTAMAIPQKTGATKEEVVDAVATTPSPAIAQGDHI